MFGMPSPETSHCSAALTSRNGFVTNGRSSDMLANIRAEEARTQLALVAYENTVLEALEEASNAIVGYEQQSARCGALGRANLHLLARLLARSESSP